MVVVFTVVVFTVVVFTVVVLVADTPAVQDLAGVTSVVEEDPISEGKDSVVVRGTIIAEACVSRIRAPDNCVLRFIDRLLLPGRIAG